MKLKDMLFSASANLFHNKSRTILTIIAIFIGTFTISLTIGVNIGINDYIDKQVGNIGGANQLTISKKQDSGSQGIGTSEPQKYEAAKSTSTQASTLDNEDVAKIKKIKNLSKVEPLQSPSVEYAVGPNGTKYTLDVSKATRGIDVDVTAGKALDIDSKEYQLNLAPEYVKSLGFSSKKEAVGKTVDLTVVSQGTKQSQTVKAKIVGVQNKNLISGGQTLLNGALSDKIVSINQEGLPDLMKNSYYAIFAEVQNSKTDAAAIDNAKDDLDKAGYSALTVDDAIGIVRNVINAITGVLTMFGAIALLAASFGIINTLYMSVQERTREIGLMKAMGLSSRKVFTMFSIEAILIGFWGSLVGIAGAWGAGFAINTVAAKGFLKELPGLKLVEISPVAIIVIMFVIMLIAFLAGTLPARRAAKLDPITALRYE